MQLFYRITVFKSDISVSVVCTSVQSNLQRFYHTHHILLLFSLSLAHATSLRGTHVSHISLMTSFSSRTCFCLASYKIRQFNLCLNTVWSLTSTSVSSEQRCIVCPMLNVLVICPPSACHAQRAPSACRMSSALVATCRMPCFPLLTTCRVPPTRRSSPPPLGLSLRPNEIKGRNKSIEPQWNELRVKISFHVALQH